MMMSNPNELTSVMASDYARLVLDIGILQESQGSKWCVVDDTDIISDA
jgi:hypothetical protein